MFSLACGLAVTVAVNFRGGGPEEVLDSLPSNIDLALKKINYTETRDGVRRWTLVADSAAHSVRQGVTSIENVELTFFDEKGEENGTLKANLGQINHEVGLVEVEGEVVVTNPRGDAFYTERLAYRNDENMISAVDRVRVVGKELQVTGRGMRLNVEDYTYELLAEVTALIPGESDVRRR
ncbi:hypothetical protein DESUT3_25600 [Desulfuromonas versatilis]|uniref:LPS export ABC transporter periplasmic protein LptC n=2 Tax=Desulfuromonas versatilis TaxID=2802975 RepID=A0ABM8HXP8_9BACT|nr:hypothetical protein DESUT3_25600 [Desulfuromonas versatilis]